MFFHSYRQKNTFKHECVKICKVLGKMLCRSEPEKIEPTSDCIESKKTCDCCCRPSCDDSKIVDECKPTTYQPTEITSKFNGSELFNFQYHLLRLLFIVLSFFGMY